MRVYLDSCVVIYAVESASQQGPIVKQLIAQHADNEYCVSELVRMECRVGPLRAENHALLADYDEFFGKVTRLPMADEAFELATDFRARHGLKTPDALHLASAILGKCGELWTNDDRLSRAGGLKIRRVP